MIDMNVARMPRRDTADTSDGERIDSTLLSMLPLGVFTQYSRSSTYDNQK
jgi:hypothetical protein